ncbi:MAG: hypothetical protein ACTS80_01220 [Candidatus Hodgkinia cicadicola]
MKFRKKCATEALSSVRRGTEQTANINDGSPREAKKMSFVHLGVSTFNLMKYFV